MSKRTIQLALNRVEGDLEFQLQLEAGKIVDARCVGTLYRGFEQILIGRNPWDALVITPRICGICSTAQLLASVKALEHIGGITPPPAAVRIRNLCLMAEIVQNDLRQTFLFFTADFCHPKYAQHAFFEQARSSFLPFKGSMHLEVLQNSRYIIELLALFGGQWPHSAFMVPGGVTNPASPGQIIDALSILQQFTRWFEQRVLGCDLEAWLSLATYEDFFNWMTAKAEHAQSAIGQFTTMSRALGLHTLGQGTPYMLSYGGFDVAESATDVLATDQNLVHGGLYNGITGMTEALDQRSITEDVQYSWFQPYPGGLHPSKGVTIPDYQPHTERYTWCKAPRYQDRVVQTGPLADALVQGEALITALYRAEGDNAWLRQFARLRRSAHILQSMQNSLNILAASPNEAHILSGVTTELRDGEGYGLVTAARGALGHWVEVRGGKIHRYQVVTPTAWNASPKDSAGRHGHWEQSLLGLNVDDPDDPVEIGHIIRAHDPCLVCTVHVANVDKTYQVWS